MASVEGTFSGRSQYKLQLNVNQHSQDIGGNFSYVSVDLRINESPNNGSYSLSNPLNWSWNVHGQTASGSTTYDFRNYDVLVLYSASPAISVGHNADGTLSIGFSAGTSGSSVIGNASCSGSMGLSTIPRASYPSFSGDNILEAGNLETINTNRASAGFTHTIEYYFGSASGTIGTGIGASTTWTPPLSLLSQIPNSASGTGIIRTYTYNGGTHIGTTDVGFTLVATAAIVPDFTTVTHAEATSGVAANVGAYVQGISSLALAITGAAGIYGSTITSYKIEVLNASSVVLQTVNAVSGTSGAIDASGTVTIRGTITDSRGRTKVKTVTTTFLAYAPPSIASVTAKRALSGGTVDEDDGTFIRVDLNAAVQSLMNTTQRNAINYRISTRNRGTTTWTVKANVAPGGITFNSNVLVTGPFAITTAYEVLVEVYDDFLTTGIILQVPVAAIFMHWDAALGVGFGKFRENGTIDVSGDIYLNADTSSGETGAIFPAATGHGIITDRVPHAGTTAQRDAYYGTPGTDALRAALANRKVLWFNTDLGWFESYYATTGLAGLTVPGLVTGVAHGWYPVGDGPIISLVPGSQQSMSSGATYTGWAAPGTGKSWRKGGTAWFTYASGVVTAIVAGRYRIIASVSVQQGSGDGRLLLTKNNATADPNIFAQVVLQLNATYDTIYDMNVGNTQLLANDNIRVYASNVGAAIFFQGADGTRERMGRLSVEYSGPALVTN